MPSCFSALALRRGPSSQQQSEDEATPAARVRSSIDKSDSNTPSSSPARSAHPAHPACAYCLPATAGRDLLPVYTPADAHRPAVPTADVSAPMHDVAASIRASLAALSPEMRRLSLEMWDLGEVAFEERRTHDLWVAYLQRQDGWEVTPHAHGLETAFRAEFEHVPRGYAGELPTVGFNAELDALPGIGHACGHNLIAIAGVSAALSVASSLKRHSLPGRVVLLGTPAEEGGGGKVLLLNAGAYAGMDACFMTHPAISSSVGTMLAVVPLTATFKGRTAHAGASPHEGVNAQDAAVLSYTNISALRQQLEPSVRVHGIIRGHDWAPNVIPGESTMLFNVRATRLAKLTEVKDKVRRCFEAGALASGCSVAIDEGVAYADVQNDALLRGSYQAYVRDHFSEECPDEAWTASTDFGNITYAMPALHPLFAIPVPDDKTCGNHTVGFAQAARGDEAHRRALRSAEGIAIVAARVVVEGEYRDKVWKQWKQWRARQPE